MSRQLDVKREALTQRRHDQLVKALEFGLAGALESQGMVLVGFAIKYEQYQSLMTLKVDVNGKRHVSFVTADSIMNCILSAESRALARTLSWREDKYHQNKD